MSYGNHRSEAARSAAELLVYIYVNYIYIYTIHTYIRQCIMMALCCDDVVVEAVVVGELRQADAKPA